MARLALVTGGTRGIGEAISIALHQAGYQVIANYAGNDETAKVFSQKTGIPAYKWNVAHFDECTTGIERVQQDVGSHVEILINNAGINRDAMMHKTTLGNWQDVIDTNLSSCFHMSYAVLSPMREQRFGRIINISSINGQAGQLGQTNYSAAKAGMLGFTKALARETALHGITVNAIAPGYIMTDMVAAVPAKAMEQILAQIPVRRLGEAHEVARCVTFLAADEAGFITGETLSVNGGHHMA